MNYNKINIELLTELKELKDSQASTRLIEKKENQVYHINEALIFFNTTKVNKLNQSFLLDELINHNRSTLYNAIRTFDIDKGVGFMTYAYKLVSNNSSTFLKRYNSFGVKETHFFKQEESELKAEDKVINQKEIDLQIKVIEDCILETTTTHEQKMGNEYKQLNNLFEYENASKFKYVPRKRYVNKKIKELLVSRDVIIEALKYLIELKQN